MLLLINFLRDTNNSTVPKTGGHTNFRNAGVHVKPESGSAIFFSYINPETLIMDNGFTEHSGCPVYEGEKKIVTQWIRLGVDDDNPWDSFNTRKSNECRMRMPSHFSDFCFGIWSPISFVGFLPYLCCLTRFIYPSGRQDVER